MRSTPLLLSLLLVCSTSFAQKDGVIVLKSDQPYVSPFDKSPGSGGPAATLFPNAGTGTPAPASTPAPTSHVPGELVGIKIFEPETPAKPAVRKKDEPRAKKDEPRAKREEPRVVKKEEPRVVKKEEPKASKKEEDAKSGKESGSAKAELKVPNAEASVIPPKEAQNEKTELTPPPALVLNEAGLTSFGKQTPAVSTPPASTVAPIASKVKIPALDAAVQAASVTAIVQSIEKPVETAGQSVPKDESTPTVAANDNTLPGWVLKAFLFFVIGGLMMLGGWYWIKRQALYGDPAFQDPWFRPVKR